MKILFAANTDWYLHNFRGALATHLQHLGCEIVMVSPPGSFVPRLRAQGFRWIEWDIDRRSLAPWSELAAIRRITEIYRAEQPDLVHNSTIKAVVYGSLGARIAGIGRVVNAIPGRGYVFLDHDPKARALRPIVHALYRVALAPKETVVLFENGTDLDYFVRHRLVPSSRAVLVEGCGVDATRFSPQPEPAGVPVILMASRMLWDKGVGTLVEAARLLSADRRVRVLLAGDPDPGNPATIPVNVLKEWHAEGVVEWLGFQSNMNQLYAQCHIVALPSNYAEGVPVSLMEAAACGRPIVTTTVQGCRDLVVDGHNGFLVEPDDPQALAAALQKLVDDPGLRRAMGAAGRQRVVAKFANDVFFAAMLNVYRGMGIQVTAENVSACA